MSRIEDLVESQSSSPQPKRNGSLNAQAKGCPMTLVLNVDSLTCELTDGHAGPHKGKGEQGAYWWEYAR